MQYIVYARDYVKEKRDIDSIYNIYNVTGKYKLCDVEVDSIEDVKKYVLNNHPAKYFGCEIFSKYVGEHEVVPTRTFFEEYYKEYDFDNLIKLLKED